MQLTLQEQEEFKQEAFELIEGIESAFLSLEGGTSLTDLYDELFRGLHNLKGASSMMEMVSLKELIHQMETSFTAYKNQPSIDDEVLTQLIKGIDQCKRLLRGESVATGENFLSLEELLKEWQSNGENPESNARVLAVFHQLKTTYSENKSTSVIIEVTLQIIASRNVACKTKIIIAKKAHELIEKIDELIKCGASPEECLPIALKFKETVGQKIEEREVFVAPKVQQVSNRPVVEAQVKSNELSSVRVNLDLLDNLLNLMGELVLVRNQVLQFSESFQNSQLGVITKKLNLVTSEIQEQMMKTRMQPIGVVLGKMNRIVRDISKSLGKKIDLKLEGDETEVDRTILDAIKDPLTHIVRNACDHGLETTEERLAQGKSEVGLLKISTYQEGGQVIVDITDDGRGINKDKILKKALQNNVIREEDASKLSDRDIYNLIFSPGFSTAEVVTDISGRGVGMDVVKTNLEEIDGTVEIITELNVGSTFRIRIPLTLAIIPVLTVKVQNEVFSIPQARLLELLIVDSSSDDIRTFLGEKILNYRGNFIPLVYLSHDLFHEECHLEEQPIVIVSHEDAIFALAVDEIQETLEIVIKPVPKIIKCLNLYSGATILGDGSISLILDIAGIAQKIGVKPREKVFKESRSVEVIQSLLTFKVGENDYAISMNYINRIEEVNLSQITKSGNYEVMEYRGELLPLIKMNILFECQYLNKDETLKVIVVDRAGKLYGILADEINDALTIQSDLMPPVNDELGIFGSIKIQDKIYAIIDPFILISKWKGESLEVRKVNLERAEKHTILIAEDIPFFRQAIKKSMESFGVKTILAEDGQEALHLLNQHPEVTVVLSDIEMPRMNGYELARAIRSQKKFDHIPVIAVTSRSGEENRKLGEESGFDAFLEKLRPEEILSVIQDIFLSKGVA